MRDLEIRAKRAPDVDANPQSKHLETVCFYLFVLGGVAGLAQFAITMPFGVGYEMVAIGTNLAKGAGFANPFAVLDAGPTAVNPPLYPLLLGVLFRGRHAKGQY